MFANPRGNLELEIHVHRFHNILFTFCIHVEVWVTKWGPGPYDLAFPLVIGGTIYGNIRNYDLGFISLLSGGLCEEIIRNYLVGN